MESIIRENGFAFERNVKRITLVADETSKQKKFFYYDGEIHCVRFRTCARFKGTDKSLRNE